MIKKLTGCVLHFGTRHNNKTIHQNMESFVLSVLFLCHEVKSFSFFYFQWHAFCDIVVMYRYDYVSLCIVFRTKC